MDSNFVEIDDGDEGKKVYYLFGQDIRRIPCLRTSMITTLSLGMGATLTNFLFSSDGWRASRLGLITISVVMAPLWLNCAWQDYKNAELLKEAEMRMKTRTNEEFTILDSLESMGSDSYG